MQWLPDRDGLKAFDMEEAKPQQEDQHEELFSEEGPGEVLLNGSKVARWATVEPDGASRPTVLQHPGNSHAVAMIVLLMLFAFNGVEDLTH